MTDENRIITIYCGKPGQSIADAKVVDVHATPVGEHMAVHPSVGKPIPYTERWSATHIPTGRQMCVAPTKEAAIAAAEAFARLPIGWSTFTFEEAGSLPEALVQKIVAIKDMAARCDIKALKAAHA
ncbi:hypothetical protein GIY21_00840 [Xanthomonas sontii]|uniref:Uncharacterized protein n=1 Tax=Xanthomonas sontii TaxID=2650745 RepID=A0A6N7Q3L2_9XANT|nr:hypothetical protein [Xanthomonas sontii]MRG98833.1 hypothetical protein [Xanthomonas sontii]MRH73376.1 hypothetical protein [Xanthomonas sontii]